MEFLGTRDLAAGVIISLFAILIAHAVRPAWISRNVLTAFILYKISLSVGFNIALLLGGAQYDGLAYYSDGLLHAELLSEFVKGESYEYLTGTPFFGTSGISVDRLSNLAGLLLTITGKSFIGINIIGGLLGAVGQLMIFKYLRQRFTAVRPGFLHLVLFHPSLCLWSSSLLKDSLGILALGLGIYAVDKLFRRVSLPELFLCFLASYIAYLYRPYVLFMLIVFAFFAFWDIKIENNSRNYRQIHFARFFYIYGAFVIVVIVFGALARKFGQDLVELQRTTDLLYNEQDAGTNFENRLLTYSVRDVLAIPVGIVNTLLRPFPWEVGKLNQAAAAAENYLMVLFVVMAWHRFLFKLSPEAKRYCRSIMYGGLVVSLITAAGIGLYSSNLGSISRYRIPVLPMLVAGPCVVWGISVRRRVSLVPWHVSQNASRGSRPALSPKMPLRS